MELDLLNKWKSRDLSWSQISSFNYNKDQWYKRYFLGEETKKSIQMEFGTLLGESFANGTPLVKDIIMYPEMEYKLRAKVGNIWLVGYADSYDPVNKRLREYKTSSSTKKWNQTVVDDPSIDKAGGQLTMYALILMLQDKVKPEELTIHLDYIPVEETFEGEMIITPPVTINTFETKRTTKDCLMFGSEILKIRKEMEKYINTYPHNSTCTQVICTI